MCSQITRRDLLDGIVASTALGALSATSILASPDKRQNAQNPYYPPTLTGMRGSHEGSFEVAHTLAWSGQKPASYQQLNENYDLVVVGAGMSGLAAAWFYRRRMGPSARILLLDNHDDFGGHAKRNEFHHKGRMVLGIGGAQNIERVSNYSAVATGLLRDLGIDQDYLQTIEAATPTNYVLAGNLDKEIGLALPSSGESVITTGRWFLYMYGARGYRSALRKLPIPEIEQEKLISFFGTFSDYLSEMSPREKERYCKTVSYNQFLVEKVGLAKSTTAILDSTLRMVNGLTGWSHSVLEAITFGAPGINSLGPLEKLTDAFAPALREDPIEIHMFPDGNATIARLLVQKLIPAVAIDMKGIEDVVTAQFNYEVLDLEEHATRLRLNSTVVGVRESTENLVEVDYVQDGKPLRITANHCVLACYNDMIPHICPQLPEDQREALGYGEKVPFVYANVLISNGRTFANIGTNLIQCPKDPFQWVSTTPPIGVGGYSPPSDPADPTAIFMLSAPTPAPQGQESIRELLRSGRFKVYATPFEEYERQIRNQLQALLGRYGFDHVRDIQAITVNRIPHGYAYFYFGLEDPEWPAGQAPHEIGRAQFRRISIANSDSEARPYMDSAFDAAWRAVNEQSS